MSDLVFRIEATDLLRRELLVTAEIPATAWPTGDEQLLFLPTWTPGSYLVREFARHLGPVEVVAADGATIARCRKVAKNRFLIDRALAGRGDAIQIRYRVFAHDLSVRTAHIDDSHVYWNHACLLLWPVGARDRSCRILVALPPGWQSACALPTRALQREEGVGAEENLVELSAPDLDHVIDAPFLAGRFTRVQMDILGVPHSIVLDGLQGVPVPASLEQDFRKIVESAAAVFDAPLPYESYLFQCLFTDKGHGGLEHASSTTLLMSRTALHDRKSYLEFCSLAAHELFHAWNVKRMRPVEFWQYDYENENYTQLLWLMEGWTAYYDDLLTLRAGLATRDDYLAALAGNLERMRSAPGRFSLSLAESSFDAWIRLYRPDENTRNSSQNYYGNGAVAAACLDLTIRKLTNSARCLDDLLRAIYRGTFGEGRGYSRADVDAALRELAGAEAVALLGQLVDGPLDPELDAIFAFAGLTLVHEGSGAPFLGITFENGGTVIASVQRDAPAHQAGLAAGDEVLALQGLRVKAASWREVLTAVARVGTPMEVLWSRRGAIARGSVVPAASPGALRLLPTPDAAPDQVILRDAWLSSSRA